MRKGDIVNATNQYHDYQGKFKERKGHIFFEVFSNFRDISCSPATFRQNKTDRYPHLILRGGTVEKMNNFLDCQNGGQ